MIYKSTKINIIEENAGQKFTLKEIDERRNYLTEETKQSELIRSTKSL